MDPLILALCIGMPTIIVTGFVVAYFSSDIEHFRGCEECKRCQFMKVYPETYGYSDHVACEHPIRTRAQDGWYPSCSEVRPRNGKCIFFNQREHWTDRIIRKLTRR